MDDVVSRVVQEDMCCSCGVCAGLCPADALSMRIRGNGDLVPCLNSERCSDKCRLCLSVCPFSEGVHNPRETNRQLFGSQQDAQFHEDIGSYAQSIIGFRRDEALRKASSSGGLVTWCLEALLREGAITRVAVVRLAKNHDKGFFEFCAASTAAELRRSSGSVYHPVDISGIIREINSNRKERWAIVGVPCLCSAIRTSPRLQEAVPFVLGLACGMYQNMFYTEMLLAKSGVDREHIEGIQYRRKLEGERPSNYRFRGTDNWRHGKELPYAGLPYFLGNNAYFRLNACNFCMDVFAEAADACFMDAWLPVCSQEPKGTSQVVIRNREVGELFKQGLANGEIWINKISADDVIASQKGHVRRKRELIYMRRGMHELDSAARPKATALEKLTWVLQRRAQNRSKKAWANYGRKYGRFAFWLAVADVLLMQSTLNNVVWMLALLQRLTRKCKKLLIHNA
jgi:coenzyme F420 hydrogenase subunit beta